MARRYAFVNGTIFDGVGRVFRGTVVVDGKRIADVGRNGEVKVPDDAVVVDLKGRFLMPGLIDAHLHLIGMRTGDLVKEPLVVPYETFVARVVADMSALIDAGFTTVGDAGSMIAVKLKQAVAEGTVRGPRVVGAGLPLSPTFGHGDTHFLPVEWVDYRTSKKLRPLMSLICDGPDDCRRAARYALREDADFIKIMATGGVLSQKDRPEYRQFTLEEIRAIVDEARAAGRFVHAHAQGAEGIKNSIAGGVKVIAHAIYIDEEGVSMAVEKGAVVVPTFSIVQRIIEVGDRIGVPEWGLQKAREVYEVHVENVRRAYRAGVKIAAGTDFVGGPFPMGMNALEVKLLAERLGMPPVEALKAATSVAAEAVGLEKGVGRIEKGYAADIVVIDGNPLEDLSVLLDRDRVILVMKEGEVVKCKID